jgi:hypothetical protein
MLAQHSNDLFFAQVVSEPGNPSQGGRRNLREFVSPDFSAGESNFFTKADRTRTISIFADD